MFAKKRTQEERIVNFDDEEEVNDKQKGVAGEDDEEDKPSEKCE
jgi:hypothetical protein